MKTEIEPAWREWLATNMRAGQNRDGLFKILLDEGYAFTTIVDAMNYRPSRPPWELKNPFDDASHQNISANSAQKTAQKTAQKKIFGNNGAAIPKGKIKIPKATRFQSDKIDLQTLDNFLSPKECADIIALIKTKMRPSSVANYQIDESVRTSQTCDLGRLDNALVQEVDDRICQMLGIHSDYSEAIQGQYYKVGQEFKAHTDFFDPQEVNIHCRTQGQRTFTVMVYLNDVEQGGETRFRRVGTAFKPITGQAVIWNSLNPDGTANMNTLHQAHPVEAGFKAVITKWFRSTCLASDRIKMFL